MDEYIENSGLIWR